MTGKKMSYVFRQNELNYMKNKTADSEYITNISTKYKANWMTFATVIEGHTDIQQNLFGSPQLPSIDALAIKMYLLQSCSYGQYVIKLGMCT